MPMNLIGYPDSLSGGNCCLCRQLVSELSDGHLSSIRNKKIVPLFREFNLSPRATTLDNVEPLLIYSGTTAEGAHRRQPVLTARALVNGLRLTLAAKPTGNS
jgi:ABC-type lipoprotein export system ATPase subunit